MLRLHTKCWQLVNQIICHHLYIVTIQSGHCALLSTRTESLVESIQPCRTKNLEFIEGCQRLSHQSRILGNVQKKAKNWNCLNNPININWDADALHGFGYFITLGVRVAILRATLTSGQNPWLGGLQLYNLVGKCGVSSSQRSSFFVAGAWLDGPPVSLHSNTYHIIHTTLNT